ncbi:MAG: thioredoxin-disulfide reductase [Lachnospiraceae bacterium]|jgi:thioredoxin reductase (NADPH)|nr:thioredoxin-disulfide reductase [Lachnospiraceae bacterium]
MEKKQLIILGSGPAGLTAAIYAKRAELDVLVVEKNMMSGGQVLNTYEVDNYPGLPGINGFEMGMKFREHADRLGVPFISDEITGLEKTEDGYVLTGETGTYKGTALIVATGATHRKLGLPREEELVGRGVSYCATCDGAFFRGRDVAVVGGGDVAVEDAIFLARLCRQVYVVHRRHELRAAKSLQARLLSMENVEMVWDSVAEELTGEDLVDGLVVRHVKTEEKRRLEVDGVFVAVGILPNSELIKGLADQDESGYLKAGEDGVTSSPGLFVAGDVRTKNLRQIVTAVSDGANCVTSVERYLE